MILPSRFTTATLVVGVAVLLTASPAVAVPLIQCPGDTDGDAIPDVPTPGHDIKCIHLGAGDGFIKMADGNSMYVFGFTDLTGVPQGQAMQAGMLAANFPAPTITARQGQEVYLTLTNVGMTMRPDLPDPHTVHWHGFPNAASVFDGLPESSISINMGASLTYYYNVEEPGTFMYHCHVEATEHMQMGMLGNLYVLPAQNELPAGTTFSNGFVHQAGNTYVYNDEDGSTRYDVEFPLQLGSLDPVFHNNNLTIQPLPFADMFDRYAVINGRGYPDTVQAGPMLPPPSETGLPATQSTQPVDALITAQQGQRILLRLSNLNITRFYSVTALGVQMQVIGRGSRLLRGPDPDGAGPLLGRNMYFNTTTVTLGGGEAKEVIIDTTNVPAGTYYLYSTNLNYLSNDQEDFGGMMTEIRITN